MKKPKRKRKWHANCTEDCRRCGSKNLIWFTASPIWNRVMRATKLENKWSMVCPRCFAVLAEKAGLDVIWELVPEQLAAKRKLFHCLQERRCWEEVARLKLLLALAEPKRKKSA